MMLSLNNISSSNFLNISFFEILIEHLKFSFSLQRVVSLRDHACARLQQHIGTFTSFCLLNMATFIQNIIFLMNQHPEEQKIKLVFKIAAFNF